MELKEDGKEKERDYRFSIDLNPDYRDLYESDSNSTSSCAGYEDWTRLDAMVHNITHIRPLCTYYKYIPTYSNMYDIFQVCFNTFLGQKSDIFGHFSNLQTRCFFTILKVCDNILEVCQNIFEILYHTGIPPPI